MSKGPRRYPVGAHPLALVDGSGATVRDVDGHVYIDWSCSLAAVTLGYCHPEVDRAIIEQLKRGISFSLPHVLEAEVAERICSVFRCATGGAVRFVKTGSEADAAACRIARRATGRPVIACVGYLGWHDWAMVRAAEHPGIPDELLEHVLPIEYGNSLDGLPWNTIAAVFIEPPLFPPPGLDVGWWLNGVREKAHANGALLMFDEIVYGGRFARGGAQEFFGVMPDLCTFGKGYANGMPLAGVCGSREVMRYADVISGTFGGETLSLAACAATLDVYQREDVIDHMWRIGTLFATGLEDLILDLKLPARLEGWPVHPRLVWTVCGDLPMERENDNARTEIRRRAMSLWVQTMANHGILLHPGGWNVSYAHTEADVTRSVNAANMACMACARALREGDWSQLRGEVISEGFRVR